MLRLGDKKRPARDEEGKYLLHEPGRIGDFMDYTASECNIDTPRIYQSQRLRSGRVKPYAGKKSFLRGLSFQDREHPLLEIHRDHLPVLSDTPRNGQGKEARPASDIKDRISGADIPVHQPAWLVLEMSPPPVEITGAGYREDFVIAGQCITSRISMDPRTPV